jgi:DNA modification methylase
VDINKIYNEDCLKTMGEMPPGFVDMVVTSPPYDGLRFYDSQVDVDAISKELFRCVKRGGVVVWVVGDQVIEGSESGSSFRQALTFIGNGWRLHDTMIYMKDSVSFPESNRYSQVFEYMFVFSKGQPNTVNIIKDRLNIHAGNKKITGRDRQSDGSLVKKRKGNLLKEFGSRFNVWRVSQGFGKSTTDRIAFDHPAIMPESIAKDHIHTWSNKGDLVYDPFGGSGTTAKMAHIQGRNWILSEISKDYCEIAQKRIDPYLMQTRLAI